MPVGENLSSSSSASGVKTFWRLMFWSVRLWERLLLLQHIFLPTSQVRLLAVSMRNFKPSPCSQVPRTQHPASAGRWFELGFNGSPSCVGAVPVQPAPLHGTLSPGEGAQGTTRSSSWPRKAFPEIPGDASSVGCMI